MKSNCGLHHNPQPHTISGSLKLVFQLKHKQLVIHVRLAGLAPGCASAYPYTRPFVIIESDLPWFSRCISLLNMMNTVSCIILLPCVVLMLCMVVSLYESNIVMTMLDLYLLRM